MVPPVVGKNGCAGLATLNDGGGLRDGGTERESEGEEAMESVLEKVAHGASMPTCTIGHAPRC